MKSVVVAICSELDAKFYLNEWVNYHLKIGFDNINVFLNNVSYETKTDLSSDPRVSFITFDGQARQIPAYNAFLSGMSWEYDWALFIDIDEFLVPIGYSNVNEMFSKFKSRYAIGFNWKLFGSNGQMNVIDDDYSVIKRFTKSQIGFDKHIKTALNLKKIGDDGLSSQFFFNNPHYPLISLSKNVTTTPESRDKMTIINGPFFERNQNDVVPYIAHFVVKSREEFNVRRSMKRADNDKPITNLDEFFLHHDKNEIENYDVWKYR